MVGLSLEREVGKESSLLKDLDILREYQRMDALSFILFSMRHPNEYPRAQRYVEICDDNFKNDLFKWLNFRHGYKWN